MILRSILIEIAHIEIKYQISWYFGTEKSFLLIFYSLDCIWDSKFKMAANRQLLGYLAKTIVMEWS